MVFAQVFDAKEGALCTTNVTVGEIRRPVHSLREANAIKEQRYVIDHARVRLSQDRGRAWLFGDDEWRPTETSMRR